METLQLADLAYVHEDAFKAKEDSEYSILAFPEDEEKNENYKENIRNCEFGGAGDQKKNRYIITDPEDIDIASNFCTSSTIKSLSEGEGPGACIFLSPTTKCETFTKKKTCTKGDSNDNTDNYHECAWFEYDNRNNNYPVGNKGSDTNTDHDGYCYDKNDKNTMPISSLFFDNVEKDVVDKNLIDNTDSSYEANILSAKTTDFETLNTINNYKYKDKIDENKDDYPKPSGRCLYLEESNLQKLRENNDKN